MNPVELTLEQLTQLVEVLYSQQENQELVNQVNVIINQWKLSPSAIPMSFTILSSSENFKLCFTAAVVFRFYIHFHFEKFSQENITQMYQLFLGYLIKRQNIESPDYTSVLLSLTDLCLVIPDFIPNTVNSLPPPVLGNFFQYLIEDLSTEKTVIIKYGNFPKTDAVIKELIPEVFKFINTQPFSENWARQLATVYQCDQAQNPKLIITYISDYQEKINLMAQTPSCHKHFYSLFHTSLLLDPMTCEVTYHFNIQLIQFALNFASANPYFMVDILSDIFQMPHDFLYQESQIEFTSSIFEYFFANLPNFQIDNDFFQIIQSFVTLISVRDATYQYPEELRVKYIYALLTFVVESINQNRFDEVGKTKLDRIITPLADSYNIEVFGNFIFSQPQTIGLYFLLSATSFIQHIDDPKKTEILNQIFLLPEIPFEALSVIFKISSSALIKPYIQKIVQLCFSLFHSHQDLPIRILKLLSFAHTEEMSVYAFDIFKAITPILHEFSFNIQTLLMTIIFNLFGSLNDTSHFEFIQNYIFRLLNEALKTENLENISNSINFISGLYKNFNQLRFDLNHQFMTQLFPSIFEQLSPILLIPSDIIQERICLFINDAAIAKCIQNYSIVLQWIETMLSNFAIGNYFSVLSILEQPPTDPILGFISKLTPNDNAQIIQEVFRYLSSIFHLVSANFFKVIPPEFLFSFLSSDQSTVVIFTLELLGNVISESNNEMLQQSLLQLIVEGFSSPFWVSYHDIQNAAFKSLAKIILRNENMKGILVNLMNAKYPTNTNDIQSFYQKLAPLSQKIDHPNINLILTMMRGYLKNHLKMNGIAI
ncbi:hypothetical protein TRFO_21253 [Tritrichomonas foetus]|uniref:Importin N-terminal domain-containing protein n=1 Tax=Tritrichomonas foetus TaxID=1144522 RepID=A0A1J4KFD3_9EUKA|nr:hypothetical protein TRFO_21253 [Tritrichomonas foetus]|eukprot:OHT09738.1 hypothetical protein TRFO_21253 [Tritrichomonas foetus]